MIEMVEKQLEITLESEKNNSPNNIITNTQIVYKAYTILQMTEK